MMEIEAKIAIDHPEKLRKALVKLGAKGLGKWLERNIILDKDFELRRKDCLLRLRKNKDGIFLTLKGPRASGKVKRREEFETKIGDLKNGLKIFKKLGFETKLVYEKESEVYQLNTCKIFIDKLPFLGYFLEIEAATEEKVDKMIRMLELEKHKVTTKTYLELFEEFKIKSGLEPELMTFEEERAYKSRI